MRCLKDFDKHSADSHAQPVFLRLLPARIDAIDVRRSRYPARCYCAALVFSGTLHQKDVWYAPQVVSYEGSSQGMGGVSGRVSKGMPAMQPSFAAVRERYLEELIEHEWYDVRTFGKKQRQEMTAPKYLVELLQHGHVTAVEMHSHTPRSDGLIEPERIGSWTHALYKKGYFRDGHSRFRLW